MKIKLALVTLSLLTAATAFAQGGSGAPSPDGQSVGASGAASADKAVQKRSDAVTKKANARAAKRAAKKASAASM